LHSLQSLDEQVLLSYRLLMDKKLARTPRLYVTEPIEVNFHLGLSPDQAHYLGRVMRLSEGDYIKVFNGIDGEWLCQIKQVTKRACIIECLQQLRDQQPLADVEYLFAPLKSARLDYMAQKATEMGASRLTPVLTEFTQNRRLKMERVKANTIEAAEQCNLLAIPQVNEPQKLMTVLNGWDDDRHLFFCDEAAPAGSPIETIRPFVGQPLALLIGPEGGFSDPERQRLHEMNSVSAISLGPRILRADTAAVAALAVLQATIGDW
jgi:16S rRNA (uracil1498-N3)-methyltransferase